MINKNIIILIYMYQVNYQGLRERDTYDEIGEIIAKDYNIKYPNRVATQMSNSPHMKQIDGETLLGLQDQSIRYQKKKTKIIIT